MNIDFYKYLNGDDIEKIEEIRVMAILLGYYIEYFYDYMYEATFCQKYLAAKEMMLSFRNKDEKLILLHIFVKNRKIFDTKVTIYANDKLIKYRKDLCFEEALEDIKQNL